MKCKNCNAFDSKNQLCNVVVFIEGESVQIKTEGEHDCFWEKLNEEINNEIDEICKNCESKEVLIELQRQKKIPLQILHHDVISRYYNPSVPSLK